MLNLVIGMLISTKKLLSSPSKGGWVKKELRFYAIYPFIMIHDTTKTWSDVVYAHFKMPIYPLLQHSSTVLAVVLHFLHSSASNRLIVTYWSVI